MQINAKKTEVMVISKTPEPVTANIFLDGAPLKTVRSFVYLGSKLSVDGRSHEDICNRMSQTKSAFFKMKSLLCNPKLDSGIRFRLWRCSVLPILLHGCESRTIRETDRRKLAARIDPQPLKFSRDWERARELVADVKWYGTQRRKKEFKIHSVETVSEVIHESKVKFVT